MCVLLDADSRAPKEPSMALRGFGGEGMTSCPRPSPGCPKSAVHLPSRPVPRRFRAYRCTKIAHIVADVDGILLVQTYAHVGPSMRQRKPASPREFTGADRQTNGPLGWKDIRAHELRESRRSPEAGRVAVVALEDVAVRAWECAPEVNLRGAILAGSCYAVLFCSSPLQLWLRRHSVTLARRPRIP